MASKRGFASMTPEKRRRIASMGGKAVPAESRSFSKDRKLASAAGRKGGMLVLASNRSFARDRKYAAECGRKGGSTPAKKGTEDEQAD
jgi:general stress protein YciG